MLRVIKIRNSNTPFKSIIFKLEYTLRKSGLVERKAGHISLAAGFYLKLAKNQDNSDFAFKKNPADEHKSVQYPGFKIVSGVPRGTSFYVPGFLCSQVFTP